jgi:hypothetical protein
MAAMQEQRKKVFFDPTANQYQELGLEPTDDEVKMMLAENNSNCPLSKIVVSEKNRGAMHILRLFAFAAYKKYDHSCRGMSFGIYCGPGQGKTHVVRNWAETIGIPYIFIQSDDLKSLWQLFQVVGKAFRTFGTPLVPQHHDRHFCLPPCIIFFDEAHALSKDIRTGGLLNAMELNDGWLRVTPPGKNQTPYEVDCRDVCWIAATTDPGILFKESQAFYDRFTNHLIWNPAGKEEICQIVKRQYPHFPQEACTLVAHYVKMPRMAISFAKQVEMQRAMMNESWDEAAKTVARINGIDEYGMTMAQINLLKALGQRPYSKNNLLIPANCRMEELERMILPPLIDDADGRGPLVLTTSKGYAITGVGLLELEKRGIDHRGDEITAERIG